MDFSERLKLWKGQILTFRNDIESARKEYENIVINEEEKDLNKLLETIEKKRDSLLEMIGIFINEINEFAPLTLHACIGFEAKVVDDRVEQRALPGGIES